LNIYQCFSHWFLGFPIGLFISDFPTKYFYVFSPPTFSVHTPPLPFSLTWSL
jgi:hypothetical protein